MQSGVGRFVLFASALGLAAGLCWSSPTAQGAERKTFRAGAAVADITPDHLPIVNSGGFLERQATRSHTPLYARALVLDDGSTRLALVIVDNLMMPRELVDEAKQAARQKTRIPEDRMLVAATHTHAAPSVMGALGTGWDKEYAEQLRDWIAGAIQRAASNLTPARVGWAVIDDPQHTHCRRWIYRPDKMAEDPFGERTVRAMMHPGYQNPAFLGPGGPVDSGLSLLALQTPDGRPIAVLANYSMHYFGAQAISADYYGLFSDKLAAKIADPSATPRPVVMMSQGTSGDQHWMDYSRPKTSATIDTYSDELVAAAHTAYQSIRYHDWVPLAMAERRLTLGRRTPDAKRLAWAKQIISQMSGPVPKNRPEVYALEQVYLDQEPRRELKLQAVRVGELGITAIPCEVFGITGLKLKLQSPLEPTFNVELANGAEGYIPPPSQHKLGGYTTWPARSAGLEVQAEPQIVECVLGLLEEVAGRPRRSGVEPLGPYPQAVLGSKPLAYWRMGEPEGPRAVDASPNAGAAAYEGGVAFYLEGPPGDGFSGPGVVNRATQLAGGWLRAELPRLGENYSVEMWFSCLLPFDARPVTGYLFARGSDQQPQEGLCMAGKDGPAGRLVFRGPGNTRLEGKTQLGLKTWHHVVLVRSGPEVCVYLDGNQVPEIKGRAATARSPATRLWIGGGDPAASWEGRLDEAAVYGRALNPEEIHDHFFAARP